MTAEQQLERSVLESKERDELHAIAQALSVKTNSRTKKADIIDGILKATGVTVDGEPVNGHAPARRKPVPGVPPAAGLRRTTVRPPTVTMPIRGQERLLRHRPDRLRPSTPSGPPTMSPPPTSLRSSTTTSTAHRPPLRPSHRPARARPAAARASLRPTARPSRRARVRPRPPRPRPRRPDHPVPVQSERTKQPERPGEPTRRSGQPPGQPELPGEPSRRPGQRGPRQPPVQSPAPRARPPGRRHRG